MLTVTVCGRAQAVEP